MSEEKPGESTSSAVRGASWYRGRGALSLGLLLFVGAAGGLYLAAERAPEEPTGKPRQSVEGDQNLESLMDNAAEILKTIANQEASRDATCWSSVRMIEGFSLGRQLAPAAEIARIEVTRALLRRLWSGASAASSEAKLTIASVEKSLPAPVRQAKKEMEIAQARSPGSAPAGPAAQGMTDQQKTTENWRAILSVVMDEARSPRGLKRLHPDAATELAKATTAMTSLVLRQAASHAEESQHDKVELADVQKAYAKLVREWFGEESPKPPASSPSAGWNAAAFGIARAITMNNAEGKLEALARYNDLKKAPSFKQAGQLAPYLSKVVGMKVTPGAAKKIAAEVRTFARLFLAPDGPLRSDTFSNSMESLGKGGGPRRYINLAHVFNATQDLFPTRKLANADAEVLMMRNVIVERGLPSVIDERRVTLEAPALDAMRDTGIHWLALSAALKSEKSVALDPFAAELLSETLSEYAYFLLEGAVRGAAAMKLPAVNRQVIEKLPWKYPQGRFFPVEDPEASTDRTPAPPPKTIPRFVERAVPESVDAEAAQECTGPRAGFQAFMGSGIGVGDFNDDGRPDLFLGADGCNRLLRNEGSFRFTDVTEEMGLSGLHYSSRHPVFADVNGDGHVDLLVTQSDQKSVLYIQKDGKFINGSTKWGLVTGRGAHSATYFDYDRDGDLDLFVGRYGPSKGNTATPTLDGRNGYANQLFRNDGGKFLNVSEESGLSSTAWTLASAAVDIDQDGFLDLWLANDFGRDQLFINRGDGTFEDVAAKLGTDDRGSGMNVSVLDLNRDEKPDVFVSMIEMFSKTLRFVLPRDDTAYEVDDQVLSSSYYISGMKLFVSSDEGGHSSLSFSLKDGSAQHIDSGRKGWAWGAAPFDYDLDGDLDLYLANGWIDRSAFFNQYNQFLINEDARLTSYGPAAAMDMPRSTSKEEAPAPTKPPGSKLSYSGSSRAVSAVDLNGDGKQDMLVLDYRGGLRVFENATPSRGSALRVKLRGKGANVAGIGATVKVFLNKEPPLVGYVSAGSDYLSQSESTLFFGLPPSTQVKKIEVTWPSGETTKVEQPEHKDALIVIDE